MLQYPTDRAFADAIKKCEQKERSSPASASRREQAADAQKLLGEIRAVDFGPDSRPDRDKQPEDS